MLVREGWPLFGGPDLAALRQIRQPVLGSADPYGSLRFIQLVRSALGIEVGPDMLEKQAILLGIQDIRPLRHLRLPENLLDESQSSSFIWRPSIRTACSSVA